MHSCEKTLSLHSVSMRYHGNMKQQDKVFMGVGSGVVAVIAIATGVYLFGGGDESAKVSTPTATSGATASTSDAATTTSTTSSTATTSSSGATTYKDGTYTANVTYYVPHGSNSLTAKVTVAGNKITAVTVNDDYSDNESAMYVDSFESAIKSAVVGHDLGSLSLSRIGGATLTTQAFDDALTTIRNDAKA